MDRLWIAFREDGTVISVGKSFKEADEEGMRWAKAVKSTFYLREYVLAPEFKEKPSVAERLRDIADELEEEMG